ncbi:MAG: phosphoribosylanthranilate isomerase [Candidatus Caldatribacteriaceae bacterium]
MLAVKVCGITRKGDALCLADLGVWALGFIFVPESPRFVHPELVRDVVRALSGRVITVGVFKDEDYGEVERIRRFCGLDFVQLHGDEDPVLCRKLGRGVIKAFGVGDDFSTECVGAYEGCVSYFLFDSARGRERGGIGAPFAWEKIVPFVKKSPHPVIVAGGLNAENIPRLLQVLRPFALDVNSGVELAPGVKDIARVREILRILQGA